MADDAHRPAILEGTPNGHVTAGVLSLTTFDRPAIGSLAPEVQSCDSLELNAIQVDALERLLEAGLYGSTLVQVVGRLVDYALLESSINGLLAQADLEDLALPGST